MPREKAIKASSGDVVALSFVLRDADGNALTEATQSEPLVLLHGHGFAIPPIADAIEGKEAGDRFELSLDEGAFGVAVDREERVIPRDRLPEGPLPAGTAVSVLDADVPRTAWVLRVTGVHVVVSFTHPWAAADRLEAEVLSVRAATPGELEAGFATELTASERPLERADPSTGGDDDGDDDGDDSSDDDGSDDGDDAPRRKKRGQKSSGEEE